MRSIRNGFGARSKVALENTDGLSKEAAAAIGAGDKSIPAPKKEGEVPANVANGVDPVAGDMNGTKGKDEPKDKKDIGSSAVKKEGELEPQLSNGEDPTLSVAKGDSGKPPKIAGTAGALESHGKKPKFSPIQRARIKVALEDAGMSSDEAEQEIRKQEGGEGVEDVQTGVPAEGTAEGGDPAGAAATAEAGEGGEAAVPPAAGAEGGEAAPAVPAELGDPAEAAAGAEAAGGEVPGDGGAAPAAEVPAGGEEAAAGLGDVPGSEAPLGDVPPAGDVGGDLGAGADLGGEAGTVDDGAPIDEAQLNDARMLVEKADARAEGRPMRPLDELGAPAPAMAPAGAEGVDGAEPIVDSGLEGGAGGELGGEAGAGLPTEVEAEAEQVTDSASGLERELLDVVEAERPVDEVNGAIAEGGEVVEALEALRETLKIATESGGLDRHGARMMQIAYESCMNRLDIPVAERPHMLSLESFGGVSKKISASQLSMEAVGQALKTVWEKIYKAILHGIQVMHQLYERITNAAVGLEKRAQAVAQQVKSVQGQPAVREFDNEQLAEALLAPGSNPMTGIVNVMKVAKGLYDAYPSMIGQATKTIAQFANADGSLQLGGQAVYPWSRELLSGWADKANGNRLMSEILPGNQQLVFFISDDPANSEASLEDTGGQAVKAKLPVLSAPQAGTLAGQVAQLASMVKNSKAAVAKSADAQKKLAELAKWFISAGEQHPDIAEKTEAARGAVVAIKNALEEPFKSFNIYAIRTGNAALNYIEASMKQYGAKAAAPAAPAGGEAPAKIAA